MQLVKDKTEVVAESLSNSWSLTEDGPLAVLIYGGLVEEDALFELCLIDDQAASIATQHLQYGYKIYGPGHNWLETK